MAEKILITPDYLEKAAASLRTAKEQFMDSITRVHNAVNNLTNTWRDELHTVAHAKYYDKLNVNLSAIPQTLEAFAEMIIGTLKVFDGMDKELKTKIWTTMGATEAAALYGISIIKPYYETQPYPHGSEQIPRDRYTFGDLLKESERDLSNPNLESAAYNEYRSGVVYNEVTYRYQCVGYAKGRLIERFGINLGAWGNGGDAASNIAAKYNGQTIAGSDGNYRVEYCSSDNIKAGSIASFSPIPPYNPEGHVVFVEDVWTDVNGVSYVKFTEANANGKGAGGGSDGVFQTVTMAAFKSYHNGLVDLVHFEKV